MGREVWGRNKTGHLLPNLSGEPPVEIPRVEELLRSLMQGLPPGLASGASGLRADLENNLRAVLRANLGKLDLAGREEFDAQRKVLERTRARLEELEKRVKDAGEASPSRNQGGFMAPHSSCR
jgi:BMFP domain-containing protein YqiC